MNRNLVHKLQSKIFSNIKYFNFIDWNNVDALNRSLVSKILNSTYEPDLIIGISSGGNYPAKEVSQNLGLELTNIGISHYNLSFLNYELDEIVGVYRLARLLGHKPNIRLTKNVDPMIIKDKNILIIDDDAYSGKTMEIALDTVRKFNPSNVKTAVLHTFIENEYIDFVGKSYSKKEFYNLRLRFPWSKISPYYNQNISAQNLDDKLIIKPSIIFNKHN